MSRTGSSQQQILIASLRDPELYPHSAKTVRVIETHISWVLLAGRFAYKIKKALDLGFLDATRLESRLGYCNEEIRLNRRLAPKLYLGVVPIGGTYVHPKLNSQPAIEYAVKMRRFAPSKTFDHLILRDKVTPQHMDALALALAHFHRHAPAAKTDASNFHRALAQNFTQLATLLPDAADAPDLQHSSEQVFAVHARRIAERGAQGYVRECHGDLHLGNIALIGDTPTPFDGIDFDPSLRNIDVMDEIAFLFMDLLHYRRTDLAYRFLNAYLERTGDYAGVELLDLYCAYRATVRAKVCAIRASQSAQQPSPDTANYLTLARACLSPRQPRLLITHGLPGSGKSTFAQSALERLGAIRLRSDVERKRLFGLSALADSRDGQNIYSAEATERTYAHLLTTAQKLLSAGHTVIVDAAFLRMDERNMFRNLAQELRTPFLIVSLQADDATLRARIRQRQALSNDASEADLNVLEKLEAIAEPLSPQEMPYTLVIQNDPAIPAQTWDELASMLD